MLAQVDLSKHLSKEEYREAAEPLEMQGSLINITLLLLF
jgi:hypothetical protein